jgi:hypothetical protein
VRAQAQNVFTPVAYWVGFAIGAGGWTMLTYEWLADGSPLLWLGGALLAGLLVGWGLGTAVMIRLAPVMLRQRQEGTQPSATDQMGVGRFGKVLLIGIGLLGAVMLFMLASR